MSRFDRLTLVALAGGALGKLASAAMHDPFDNDSATQCRSPHGTLLPPVAVQQLQQTGWCVVNDAVSPRLVEATRRQALALVKTGAMHDSANAKDVRQDIVSWVEARPCPQQPGPEAADLTAHDPLLRCAQQLRGIGWELENNATYTRTHTHTVPRGLQLAMYDGQQASYRAHRDNATGPSTSVWALGLVEYLRARPYKTRAITAILYLNPPEWDVGQSGGALRMYLDADPEDDRGNTATQVRDVSPCGGTLVVFDSRHMLHEVLPTCDRRLALTTWICGAPGLGAAL